MTKTPITISYQETAFTLRWDDNRQAIHDQAYQVLLEGRHIPDTETTRPFVYDVTLLDQASGLALATARGQALSNGIQSESAQLTVKDGDALTIRVRLSATTRKTEQSGDRRRVDYQYVAPHDVAPWATALLSRNGLVATDIKLLDYQKRQVFKRNHRFGINEAYIEAQVTVASPVDFARGFLTGVGRHKGYGLGMMEVVA